MFKERGGTVDQASNVFCLTRFASGNVRDTTGTDLVKHRMVVINNCSSSSSTICIQVNKTGKGHHTR